MIMQPLARLGITPNTLTCIGLLLSAVTALVIASGYLQVGGVLVLFAGIFDMFDGAMARVRSAATTFGAFLDSTLDRYSESIILFGLFYYAMQHTGLQEPLWPFGNEQMWMMTFIFASVVGSLMVSYTKARAEGLGLECKTGLLARPERVVLLAIGLLTHTGIWALALLAVFSHITAIERILSVWRTTRRMALNEEYAEEYAAITHTDTHPQDTSRDDRRPEPARADESSHSNARPVSTGVPPFSGGTHQQ